ncbi:MAG: hypothetical protein KDA24_10475 [Deltaproteobacteria bacterium]|nr:hypothetical protein [Deltaproteobacteria bacterium]
MPVSRRQSLLVIASVSLAMALPGLAMAGKKPPKKRKGDLIAGTAVDQVTKEPVGGAMVEIYPVEPKSKKSDVTIYTDVLGVDTSSAAGTWSVEMLSSPSAYTEMGLLRGWSYQVVVTAPGFYQLRSDFEYKKGNESFTLELVPKVTDVVDGTGVVADDGEKKFMSRGQVLRGN